MSNALARRVLICGQEMAACIREGKLEAISDALEGVETNSSEILAFAIEAMVHCLITCSDREAAWIFLAQTINNGVFEHDCQQAAGGALGAMRPEGTA